MEVRKEVQVDSRGLRAALLISGHPRRWQEGCAYINDVMRPCFSTLDIYVHLWSTLDARTTWHKTSSPHWDVPTPLNRIARELLPARCSMEDLESSKFTTPHLDACWNESKTRPYHIVSQWYSLYQAWSSLEKSKNTYDIVIRHRLDALPKFVVIPQYESRIIAPGYSPKWLKLNRDQAISDVHAYSSQSLMRIYCGQYLNWRSLLSVPAAGYIIKGELTLCPERALSTHLRQASIPVVYQHGYRVTLLRMDGTQRTL